MSLTNTQKILVENLLMVIDEEIATWRFVKVDTLNRTLEVGFNRVKNSLRHKKNAFHSWNTSGMSIGNAVGKEVRKARAYVDIPSNDVIEVLDVVFNILKTEESN